MITIMTNPRQYKIPDWFLNRQKDVKDGKYSQVSSVFPVSSCLPSTGSVTPCMYDHLPFPTQSWVRWKNISDIGQKLHKTGVILAQKKVESTHTRV